MGGCFCFSDMSNKDKQQLYQTEMTGKTHLLDKDVIVGVIDVKAVVVFAQVCVVQAVVCAAHLRGSWTQTHSQHTLERSRAREDIQETLKVTSTHIKMEKKVMADVPRHEVALM